MARKKRITAKQKAARRKNMAIAREAKKRGGKKPWKPKVLGGQNKLNRFLRTKGGGWIKNPIYK